MQEPEPNHADAEGTNEDDLLFDAPTVPMLPAAPSGPLEEGED